MPNPPRHTLSLSARRRTHERWQSGQSGTRCGSTDRAQTGIGEWVEAFTHPSPSNSNYHQPHARLDVRSTRSAPRSRCSSPVSPLLWSTVSTRVCDRYVIGLFLSQSSSGGCSGDLGVRVDLDGLVLDVDLDVLEFAAHDLESMFGKASTEVSRPGLCSSCSCSSDSKWAHPSPIPVDLRRSQRILTCAFWSDRAKRGQKRKEPPDPISGIGGLDARACRSAMSDHRLVAHECFGVATVGADLGLVVDARHRTQILTTADFVRDATEATWAVVLEQ